MAISNWKLIAGCLLASFVGGGFTSMLFNPSKASASVADEIRAKRFVVVCEDGVECGELMAVRDSGGELKVWRVSDTSKLTPGRAASAIRDGAVIGWDLRAQQYHMTIARAGEPVVTLY